MVDKAVALAIVLYRVTLKHAVLIIRQQTEHCSDAAVLELIEVLVASWAGREPELVALNPLVLELVEEVSVDDVERAIDEELAIPFYGVVMGASDKELSSRHALHPEEALSIPLLVVVFSYADNRLSQSAGQLVGEVHSGGERPHFTSILDELEGLEFVSFHLHHKLPWSVLQFRKGIQHQLHLVILLLIELWIEDFEVDVEALPFIVQLYKVRRVLLASTKECKVSDPINSRLPLAKFTRLIGGSIGDHVLVTEIADAD